MNLTDNLFEIVLFLALGFFSSLLTVGVTRYFSRKYGWLVQLRTDRWHRSPTALHGGVGMMIAWLPLSSWLLWKNPEVFTLAAVFLVGTFLMFLLGLFDDLFHFPPATKLVWQIVASGILIGQGVILNVFPWYAANVFLTFVWFIGIINAVNMLDNMDGLSAGAATIGAIVLWVVFATGGGMQSLSIQWLTIFIGILLGFLVYNFNPASIFMGDSGSLFIGYFLAAISVPSAINHRWFLDHFIGIQPWSFIALLAPAMILAVPIFDTTLVTISRKWNGRSPSQGGLDHSSHRLVGLGLSERQAVSVLYGVAAVGGLVSLLSYLYPEYVWLLFLSFLILLGLFGFYLGRFKVYEEDKKTEPWTPLVTNLQHKRRFSEALMDFVFIALAYKLTFQLLFEGDIKNYSLFYMATLPWVLFIMIFIFWWFGFYRGPWHLLRFGDLSLYIEGIIVGNGFLVGLYSLNRTAEFHWWPQLTQHQVGVPVLFGMILVTMILSFRISLHYFNHFLYRKCLRRQIALQGKFVLE